MSRSLPSRGAWIEIENAVPVFYGCDRRSPHGERGLKLPAVDETMLDGESLPSRGAWIEICRSTCTNVISSKGRSPHGERGLKLVCVPFRLPVPFCRSPHGERGLKYSLRKVYAVDQLRRSPHGERGLK